MLNDKHERINISSGTIRLKKSYNYKGCKANKGYSAVRCTNAGRK